MTKASLSVGSQTAPTSMHRVFVLLLSILNQELFSYFTSHLQYVVEKPSENIVLWCTLAWVKHKNNMLAVLEAEDKNTPVCQ